MAPNPLAPKACWTTSSQPFICAFSMFTGTVRLKGVTGSRPATPEMTPFSASTPGSSARFSRIQLYSVPPSELPVAARAASPSGPKAGWGRLNVFSVTEEVPMKFSTSLMK